MERLAEFVVYLAVTLISVLSGYIRISRRSTALDTARQSETDQLRTDNTRLQKQLTDMEILLNDLRKQMITLSHFQVLYETLKEAHDGLKMDHDELKGRFEKKVEDWKIVQQELEAVKQERARLEKQNGDLFEANKALKIENNTYRQAIALLGIKLADDRETTEPKPILEPQAGEIPAPETQEG